MDDLIQFGTKDGPLSPSIEMALKSVRANLNTQIDSAAKGGSKAAQLFREGDAEFSRLSPPIERLKKTIIGKIANKDDSTLRKIVSDLFNPEETDPTVLLKAKKQIEDVDKGAWRDIYRQQLQRKIAKGKDIAEDSTGNLPSIRFNKLFGNERETKMLIDAAPDEFVKSNIKYFKAALERAQIGRRVNSATQPFSAIEKELRGKGATGVIAKLLSPKKSTTELFGEERR